MRTSPQEEPPPRLRRGTIVGAALVGALAPWLAFQAWPTVYVALTLGSRLAVSKGSLGVFAVLIAAGALAAGAAALADRVARRTPAPNSARVALLAFLGGVIVIGIVPYLADPAAYAKSWWLPTAVLSAVAAAGCCHAAVLRARKHSWIPFAVVGSAVAILLLLAPVYPSYEAEAEAEAELRDAIDSHGRDFAVLDDDTWRPHSLEDFPDGGLRLIYRDAAERTLHIDSGRVTLRSHCDLEEITCSEQGEFLVLEKFDAVDEVRLELDDYTVATMRSADTGAAAFDLLAIAEELRPATPDDHEELVDALSANRSET